MLHVLRRARSPLSSALNKMANPPAGMTASAHVSGTMRAYTKTNLGRWSCIDKELPGALETRDSIYTS